MSIEVIELMIKESLRDGVISENEKVTILQEAEAFGISKNIVESILDEQKKLSEKIKNDKLEKDRLEIERKENLRFEIWDMTFKEMVKKWIRKSDKRVLAKDYIIDLRIEAEKSKIEFKWLDNWIEELEKSEQSIAGIKKGFFSKFFGK